MADQNQLLRWAIEHQDTQEEPTQEKKQERQEFIENLDPKWFDAIFGNGVGSDTDRMKAIIAALKNPFTSAEQKAVLFEEMDFLCELTHNANALHKLGGLEVTLESLEDSNSSKVRLNSCGVLATSLPNNLSFQKQVLENGGLPMLLKLLNEDSDVRVQGKGLLALSGLIRVFPEGMKAFLKAEGDLAVVNALKNGDMKIKRRAAFLLNHLFSESEISLSRFHEFGGTNALLEVLSSGDIDLIEKSLSALRTFARKSEKHCNILIENGCSEQLQKLKTFCDSEKEKDPEFDGSGILENVVALEAVVSI